MKYNEDFKNKVKRAYGDYLNETLDSGNMFLGRYLDDGRNSFSATTILRMQKTMSPEDFKEKMEKSALKDELWREWCDMYDSQRR